MALFAILAILMNSCAAQLEYEKNIKSPHGQAVAEVIDLNAVTLLSVKDGGPVQIGSYMDERQLDYLLLFFGSKGCGICTEKSVQLRDHYLEQHALWRAPEAQGVELIGVSTDALASRGLVQRFALQNRFDHYRWLDPQGAAMLKWFMPEGHSIGVPFTVMLSRAGILWRVTADDKAGGDVAALLDRAYDSVRRSQEDPGTGSPPVPDDGKPDDRDDDEDGDDADDSIPVDGVLATPSAERLRGQDIISCGSGKTVDLHETLGAASFRLIQVFPKSCDGDCRESFARVQQVADRCGHPQGCAAVGLLTTSEDSCPASMYAGGDAFIETFGTAFDWRHEVTMNSDWTLKLAEFEDPLLFIFDPAGNLVHTEAGHLSEARLEAILASNELPNIARSFDLPVFFAGEAVGLADLRRQSEFTVIFGFERFCESCQHEMAAFNRPGHLYDYCAARPSTCQVIAMENTDRDEYADWDATVNATLAQSAPFREAGLSENRIPLVFDIGGGEDPATAFLARYYTGYLAARFPAFDRGWGGIVVYNREGRLIGKIDPADTSVGEQPDPDHAFSQIKAWIEN